MAAARDAAGRDVANRYPRRLERVVGRAVVDVIRGGAAGSWQMENRHATMIAGEFEHGFAVDWMRKDLRIYLQTAEETGAALPATALIDQFYKDVQAMGGGRWDTSSLIERLRAPKG
jgi:3-hydroxyisobutyrate dehydrogenase